MNHLMIDIETLGTQPNAPIIAIGAVFFDPDTGELGAELDTHISLITAMKNRPADPNTLRFWMNQSDEARHAMTSGDKPLDAALSTLANMIRQHTDPDQRLKVWANGPSFDLTILKHAYHQYNMNAPWPYNADRDVRTICDLAAPNIDRNEFTFNGEPHCALDDAKHQVKYVSAMWQHIKGDING